MTTELGIVIPLREQTDELDVYLTKLGLVLIKNSINAEITIISASEDFHLSRETYDKLHSSLLLKLKCLTVTNAYADYGRLLRVGIANVDARFVILMTPDGNADVELLPKLLAIIRNGTALVIVNRFTGNMSNGNFRKASRAQKVFRIITSTIVGVRMPEDSTFVYRMFTKSSYEYLAVSGNSWDMLAEHTIKTLLNGEDVKNLDGRQIQQPSTATFSYLKNCWSYLRIIVRGLFHRLGLPWF